MKTGRAGMWFFLLAMMVPSWARADQLDRNHPEVQNVIAVQEGETQGLMAMEGVLGTAVGLDANDEVSLVVFLDRDNPGLSALVKAIPPRMRGVGVSLHVTDKFRAMGKISAARVDHRATQSTPISLGTSGGWGLDLANGYCCGGTLGSLVQIAGIPYILSNYHVLEADIEPGGNGIVAMDTDAVIQPGLIDVGCQETRAQPVATLEVHHALPDNNVDAAIAKVSPEMVRTDGAILEIGAIFSQTVGARIGQPVKKSGRTTGLTTSKVSGLNAVVSVVYDNECAGSKAFTKTFTGQIVVGNNGSKFLNSGDSGSLMVENVATSPRAVGLLFAGSSTTAIANPIDEVLTFFGATMVGK